MLSCSKTLAALELPSTLGSQEPVSAYPPYIWLYPTSPGSTQLSCELMETLISGEESCSQKSPASLLCVWAWGGGGGVQSPGWASWGGPWLLFLGPSQEHRHPPPPATHTPSQADICQMHHKTLTRHIKAACQPSGASAGSRKPPRPAKTDGKGPDTVAPGYTGSPDA